MAYSVPYYSTNTNDTILDIYKNKMLITVNLVINNTVVDLPDNNILLLNENNINLYKYSSVQKICLDTINLDTIIEICKSKWFNDIVKSKVEKINCLDMNKIIYIQ